MPDVTLHGDRPLKIGDRVWSHYRQHSTPTRSLGTVTEIHEAGWIIVTMDTERNEDGSDRICVTIDSVQRANRWDPVSAPNSPIRSNYRTPADGAFRGTLNVSIVGDREKHRLAILDALAVLGTGDCPVPNCPGCQYERDEAISILRGALGWGKHASERTAHGYEESPS